MNGFETAGMTMGLWALVGAAAVGSGCQNEPPLVRVACVASPDSAAQRADFIVACAAAANPKSDEEGEDLVAECRRSADSTYCVHEWRVRQGSNSVGWSWTPCRLAPTLEKRACRARGWTRMSKRSKSDPGAP